MRTEFPFVEMDFLALFQVLEEKFRQFAAFVPVVEDEVDFEVLLETPHVHVGGSHGGHEPVHDDDFAVVESGLVLEYPHARRQQFLDVRAGAPARQWGVRFVGNHDAHVHAAHGRRFQRVDGGFARHEVGGRDIHVFPRQVDEREIGLLDGGPVAVRTGGHGLNHHVAVRLVVGEVFRFVQQHFLAHEIPDEQEDGL